MFKAVKETDKFGKQQTHYYLTQGDSCTIYARPIQKGVPMPVSDVEKCIFKMSDLSYVEEFSKECFVQEDKFVLKLTHEETSKFEIAQHIYEFEYTLSGGEVATPNQWKFDIIDQIIT